MGFPNYYSANMPVKMNGSLLVHRVYAAAYKAKLTQCQ